MPLQKQLHIIPIAALDMMTLFVCLIWDLGPKGPLAYPRRGDKKVNQTSTMKQLIGRLLAQVKEAKNYPTHSECVLS